MTRNILFSFPDGDGIDEGRMIYTAALRENDSLADGLCSLSMVQINDLTFFHEGRAVDPFLSAHAQGILDRSEVLAVKHAQSVPDQNEFAMSIDPVYIAHLESKSKTKPKASTKKKPAVKAAVTKKKSAGIPTKLPAQKAAALKKAKIHNTKKQASKAPHKPEKAKTPPGGASTSKTGAAAHQPKTVGTSAKAPTTSTEKSIPSSSA
eukprot:199571_1